MSPTSSQQWTRRVRYTDQNLRVSDAERNAVAERLGVYYSEGRLDQAEFDERVSQAMAAKTRGDLDGLFDDLPDPEPTMTSGTGGPGSSAPYRVRRRGGPGRPFLLLAIVVAVMFAVGHAFASLFFFIPWFWIAILVAVVLFATRWSRARHDR